MEREYMFGLKDISMRENSSMASWTEKGFSSSRIESTKESGQRAQKLKSRKFIEAKPPTIGNSLLSSEINEKDENNT